MFLCTACVISLYFYACIDTFFYFQHPSMFCCLSLYSIIFLADYSVTNPYTVAYIKFWQE
ncbi:hypothetical protein V1524DRAFT_21904 [Lipomyces starkeyi]